MNIEHISVSRKKTFDQCPQLYKYKYHLKIPIQGPEPFHFTYGKIVHKIAETYVEHRGQKSLGEVSTDVLRGKIEYEEGKKAPKLPNEYKTRMPGHLRSIQKLTDSIGVDGVLEYQFRYDLDPPHEKFVTGFIDRLIVKDDRAFIIDYKTTKKGTWRETKESILYDIQLRCYSRVVQKEFGIPAENIKAALYYLEGGDLLAAQYSAESLLRAEAELLDVYNRIVAADPDQVWGKVGPHCARCDYCEMCPFYRGKSKADAWDGTMPSFGG